MSSQKELLKSTVGLTYVKAQFLSELSHLTVFLQMAAVGANAKQRVARAYEEKTNRFLDGRDSKNTKDHWRGFSTRNAYMVNIKNLIRFKMVYTSK